MESINDIILGSGSIYIGNFSNKEDIDIKSMDKLVQIVSGSMINIKNNIGFIKSKEVLFKLGIIDYINEDIAYENFNTIVFLHEAGNEKLSIKIFDGNIKMEKDGSEYLLKIKNVLEDNILFNL